jgi:alkylated DNA repair dioxygenase AlkB
MQVQDEAPAEMDEYVEYIPKAISTDYEQKLAQQIRFPAERLKCKVFGKVYDSPRDQALFHFEKPVVYRFSGMAIQSELALDILVEIRDWIFKNIEGTADGKYNVVLVNRYVTGKDKVGWHSDDDGNNDEKFPIISISFGGTRKFQVRLKHGKERPITNFALSSGDVIVMKAGCQQHFVHQVPATAKKVSQRFNLTFRSSK